MVIIFSTISAKCGGEHPAQLFFQIVNFFMIDAVGRSIRIWIFQQTVLDLPLHFFQNIWYYFSYLKIRSSSFARRIPISLYSLCRREISRWFLSSTATIPPKPHCWNKKSPPHQRGFPITLSLSTLPLQVLLSDNCRYLHHTPYR